MHLVLGSFGAPLALSSRAAPSSARTVAFRLVEELVARNERVVVLSKADELPVLPAGVETIVSDATAIDLGLSGENFLRLQRDVAHIYVAECSFEQPRDASASRLVRLAVEVCEFILAGGAPRGVTFLSSLLVFGSSTRPAAEGELFIKQRFADPYEQALALAEKVIRRVQSRRRLNIVRSAPVVADEGSWEVFAGSPLAALVNELRHVSPDAGYLYSDLPIYWETTLRAAKALIAMGDSSQPGVAHLVDRQPLTDRQFAGWLCGPHSQAAGDAVGGARAWAALTRTRFCGARALRGWSLPFLREEAEKTFFNLLDRDEYALLAKLFPESIASGAV